MKVALKLGKRHKVVNLTSGACAATTSTTLDCALVSPQLGVAVVATKAELAVAQGVHPLIAGVMYQTGSTLCRCP